jgi:hypothetical protein
MRDTPDVSLFAGDGMNSSFYVFCEMDANASSGGSSSSCDLNAPYLDFQGAGGTSASAQAFGGIMALVNQRYGRQGNANYVLYPLAAQSGASCASSASMAPTANTSSCIFYDIGPGGNNSVACQGGSLNCSNTKSASGNYGILEVNPPSNSAPAWATATGYDLATGLGTVNAYNLVQNWKSNFTLPTVTLNLSPTTITHGQGVNVTVNVTPASATGDVSLIGGPNNSNLGIDWGSLSSGTASGTTHMLPGGTYGVTAHYAGDGTYGASDSNSVTVTVSPESSQTVVRLATLDCNRNATYGVTVPYGYSIACLSITGSTILYSGYLLRVDVTNSSGNSCINSSGIPTYQCPTGPVIVTHNGHPLVDLGAPPSNTPGTYQLNSQGHFEDDFVELPAGTENVVASYAGNTSYNGSKSATDTITVNQATTTIAVTASPTTVISGASVTLMALVSTTSLGFAPTGAVLFYNGANQINGTVTPTPVNGSASGYASLTATLTTSFTANASITAIYIGDNNYRTSTSAAVPITFSSGTPDFSLVATPNSFIITSPGLSGSTTIGLSPSNGFTGTVSLSCSVPSAMTGGSCSLASTSITPSNSTTTLTVNTAAPSTVSGLFNSPHWLAPIGGAIFAAFFLLLIPTKRRRLKLAFGSLFLVLLAAALVACGGSSSVSTTTIPGTPTGPYTVTVTGTSGSLSHPALVTVNVQ